MSGTGYYNGGNFVPVAIWEVLAQSSLAVVCPADTNENILANIVVPAGAMGPNGRLRVTSIWSMTSSANNKQVRLRMGGIAGVAYQSIGLTTSGALVDQRQIGNRGAENSQVGSGTGGLGGFAASASVVTSSVDTAANSSLVITGQKATAGEALVLESYVVELLSAP